MLVCKQSYNEYVDVQSAERRVQSAECRAQSADRRVQSAECRVQNAERRVHKQSAERMP